MTVPGVVKKDRIDLKLYNTIAIVDVYFVARDGIAARDALIELIAAGAVKPTEVAAMEVRQQGAIRSSWIEQKPFVAGDVIDEEFETLRGVTVGVAFSRFYERRA